MKNKIKQEVEKYLKGTNPCHDMMHTKRVVGLALHIGEVEGADLQIIELGALLHDVARKFQDESDGEICHAEKGAEIAKEILEKYKFSNNIIEKIVHCVAAHRFRGKKQPQSLEAKIISDADNLDAIGAIGIGRAFSFAGHIGAYVHDSNIDMTKAKAYSKDDSAYREFLIKLKKVKDRIFTVEGKRIAKKRHQFMVDFFWRLNDEVRGWK